MGNGRSIGKQVGKIREEANAQISKITAEDADGAVLASKIDAVTTDIFRRHISEREAFRVQQALSGAAEMCRRLFEDNQTLRSDAFFDPTAGRDGSSEIVEGILLAAQRQWEEKKVRHLGYALANIAFHEEIDMRTAAYVIYTAEQLSWMQLISLAIVATNEDSPLPEKRVGEHNSTEWDAWTAHRELNDLLTKWELIGSEPKKTPNLGLSVPNMNIADFRLRAGGFLIYELLNLSEVPDSERMPVRDALSIERSA
ncbi:hypothetical protein ABZ835_14550 [Streptomyces sp. NPDC047461]|uniref:hypothetical protein n=1 Tax=Streptomyces sp. NPDC047461 TaxID=3155619 RepID=UPI0033F8440B